MTQPNCRVCGRFIAEHDLWNCASIECCEEHGFIQICGPCREYFEKYGSEDKCIIKLVRIVRKNLNPSIYPQYACPVCDYQSHSFTAAFNHMAAKNHLYQGTGTYPIYVQGPETDPRVLAEYPVKVGDEVKPQNIKHSWLPHARKGAE